jgi:glycosyltransferase involved in cell wall biosynthesis
VRVVAILATFNEARFVAGCIEHLREQGVDVYLIDNQSTDDTVTVAERYLGAGLIGIETMARSGASDLSARLARKEELAQTLDADWLMHIDADEFHIAARPSRSLAQAFAEVDAAGFNAVNFIDYTFVPTQEEPDHDHPDFTRTMRYYYPYLPSFPHRLNAWKRQEQRVELAWSAGHKVHFAGLRMAPRQLAMRHYLFLSVDHAIEKYVVSGGFADHAVKDGWHGWRHYLERDLIELPRQAELRHYVSDDLLDRSEPWARHLLVDAVPAGQRDAWIMTATRRAASLQLGNNSLT